MNQEILKQNFENHGFKTAFFSTAKEAADYLSARIRETSVSIGGSITVKEMGLAERLRENNEVIWHWDIPGRETLLQAREAKVYLASANGVSETGELVNIDGTDVYKRQGLCVNPNENYVKVAMKEDGTVYYLAEALCDAVLGADTYEVKERYKGKELEYKEYEPLFDCALEICKKQKKKAYYITCGDFVTLTDGTGVVHIAPAFGEDDSRIGREYSLPFVQLVNSKGEMEEGTPCAGVFCKKADPMVLQSLKEKGLLLSAPVFEHSYPPVSYTHLDVYKRQIFNMAVSTSCASMIGAITLMIGSRGNMTVPSGIA